jgi:deoxyadenosine/deoxycytidine kinase
MAVDPEPVQRWMPFLNEVYRHNRGAFNFQTRVWLDRCWIQEKPATHIVMERSGFFQANVFVPINAENGLLTPDEHQMLREMYDRSFRMWSPRGMIYLRSSPDNCLTRIQTRGRPEEMGITAEYLQRIHDFHETAYMHGIAMGLPIVCIETEGKTPAAIAGEVATALRIFGARSARDPRDAR